jgi:endogenous inhibitor of DNA gyrase (YacG/DUF329 family)
MADPKCPICETRGADPAFKPFCSRRCADIDLGRWLKGGYVVPGGPGGAPAPDGDEDPDAQG